MSESVELWFCEIVENEMTNDVNPQNRAIH